MKKNWKINSPHHPLSWVLELEGIRLKFLSIFRVVKFTIKIKKGTTQGSTILRNYDYTKSRAFNQLEDNTMSMKKFNMIMTILGKTKLDIKEPRALEIALNLSKLSL